MRLVSSLLLWPFFAAADPFPEGPAWVPVPATPGVQLSSAVALPDPSSAEVIRLVSTVPSIADRPTATRQVFGFDVTTLADPNSGETLMAVDEVIPAEAHWPDSHDRIVLVPLERGNPKSGAGIRNPWEVRVHAKYAGEETVLACGGIIKPADGGSVALLNGRLLRRGDTLGEFNVARIRANEVVLVRNGTYVVIPRGRRVIVATSAH
jgi:hypothetical protein